MVVPFLQVSPRLLIVFDCINNQLLIAKINAYGVDTNSLHILASHYEKRKQRKKVNGSYSNFNDIFSGVPQGSRLCLLRHTLSLHKLTPHSKNPNIIQ